jgi:high-affinity Fe2+/Pb2+ permease
MQAMPGPDRRARVPDLGGSMLAVLTAVLLAALIYWLCVALGLPAMIGIVAAALVLVAGIRSGANGDRGWSERRL